MRRGQFVNCSGFVLYNTKNAISEDNDLAELRWIFTFIWNILHNSHAQTQPCTFEYSYCCVIFTCYCEPEKDWYISISACCIHIIAWDCLTAPQSLSPSRHAGWLLPHNGAVWLWPASLTNWAHLQLEIPRFGPPGGGQSASRHQTEMTITTITTITTVTAITIITTITTVTTITTTDTA